MAGETIITIVGNTTAPAELRFTPSGSAVANFTIASTPRTFDKQSNEWKDGETLFLRCGAWREMAENVAETLQEKGMRIVVQGRLKSRSYETKEGEKRTVMELEVDEIGPSLRYASAKVTRTQRGNGGNTQQANTSQGWGSQHHDNQQSAGNLYPERGQQQTAPAEDPWGAPGGQQQAWGNGPASQDPPF